MNIREDFKFDPESWEKQAKELLKKSIQIFVPLLVILPIAIYFLTSKLSDLVYELFGRGSLSTILMSIIDTSPYLLLFMPFFYLLFFFKRVDFGEKVTVTSILKDIKNTFREFLSMTKSNKVVPFFLWVFSMGFCIMAYSAVFSQGKDELVIGQGSLLTILNGTSGWLSVFLLWSFSSLGSIVLGMVYIGYKMVNSEGAAILTRMAYSKYPDLKRYVGNQMGKTQIAFLGIVVIKLVLTPLLGSSDAQQVINIVANYAYIIYSAYVIAIIYLISRDLYGGSPSKVKQEVDVDLKSIVPQI